MAFGKRQSAQGPDYTAHQPTLDDDGKLRVTSKENWNGPQGDFLREIGVSPDDPSNIIESHDDAQKRLDAARVEAIKFAEGINAQLPAKVEPWSLIPVECWRRKHGDYLLRMLGLTPFGPWNTILLPFDPQASLILGIPVVHPGHHDAIYQGFAELAEQFISGSRANFTAAAEETRRQLQSGNTDGLHAFSKTKDAALAEILAFAVTFGVTTVGDKSYWRSRELFFNDPRPPGMPDCGQAPILPGLMAHLNGAG